jgi:ribosome-associated heat shock protein Hsp15
MRVDKLLWFIRFAKTRNVAQGMAEAGHIRLNGRRIERAHQKIAVGDVLVIPTGNAVHVIELLALPARRGGADEAHACYRVLDGPGQSPIAAAETTNAAEGDLQP